MCACVNSKFEEEQQVGGSCNMEVNIPENLENLKRPALQKLCKRLGLKANGKVQTFVAFSHIISLVSHTEACVHG